MFSAPERVRERRGHDDAADRADLHAEEAALETLDDLAAAELEPVRVVVVARVLERPALLSDEAAHELKGNSAIAGDDCVAAARRDVRDLQPARDPTAVA